MIPVHRRTEAQSRQRRVRLGNIERKPRRDDIAMSKRNASKGPRREQLRESLKSEREGGVTLYAITEAVRNSGGEPTQCTLTGHCRTFLFEFPGSELVTNETTGNHVIRDQSELKAAIVSDLPNYFENGRNGSRHFNIDVSLRAAVRNTHETSRSETGRATEKLFLVVEEYTELTPTELSAEQCFRIDEARGDRVIIEGGREGETALLAVKAVGYPWPDFRAEMDNVNIVLAGVKAAQNVTGHIKQIYECSCFVNNHGEAVYILNFSVSGALGVTRSRLKAVGLKERADEIRAMVNAMMNEPNPMTAELFDAIVFDERLDDDHLRLSYLRLWEGLEDAKHLLEQPKLRNKTHVIAGHRSPKELKDYRNDIAHWKTGKIDRSYLDDLQHTVMELLRRKYGKRGTRTKDSECRRGGTPKPTNDRPPEKKPGA